MLWWKMEINCKYLRRKMETYKEWHGLGGMLMDPMAEILKVELHQINYEWETELNDEMKRLWELEEQRELENAGYGFGSLHVFLGECRR